MKNAENTKTTVKNSLNIVSHNADYFIDEADKTIEDNTDRVQVLTSRAFLILDIKNI
jgi:hypothetical protein